MSLRSNALPIDVRMWYESPDGITLRLTSPESTVVGFSGFGAPQITNTTAQGVNQHGTTLISQRFDPRVMTIQLEYLPCGCWGLCAGQDIPAGTAFERTTYGLRNQVSCGKRMSIKLAHAIITNTMRCRGGEAGRLWIEFPDYTRRYIHVFPQQLPQYQFNSRANGRDDHRLETFVRLFAPNPLWRGEDIVVETGNDNLFDLPILYCGTERAYPNFTLFGSMSAPIFFYIDVDNQFTLQYDLILLERVIITLDWDSTGRQVKRIISNLNGDITANVTDIREFTSFHFPPDPETDGGNFRLSLRWNANTLQSNVRIEYNNIFLGAII